MKTNQMKTKKLTTEGLRKIIKEEMSQQDVIIKLAKQYKKLEKGILVPITVTFEPVLFKTHLRWEEDVTASYDSEPSSDKYRDNYFDSFYNSVKSQIEEPEKQFNEKIKSFIELCNQYAKKFKMNEDEFFEMVTGRI